MPFDPALVRASFALVEQRKQQAAAYFYGRLFAENPQLRSLFPAIMDVQRDRLFGALARVIELVDRPGQAVAYVTQLGRDHRKFGVAPEHYTALGRALLATVRHFAAARWDSATEAAWVAGYTEVANIMIEAAAADEAPPWWTGEVVGHSRRTADVAVITVRVHGRLPYVAGQYVSVQTPRWPRVWRNYSIANAPRADGQLSLHVQAVPGGLVSNALVHRTAVGDSLLLGPAVGGLRPPSGGRPLVLVAGGTGLAPLKAIVEHVLGEEERPPIHLFYDMSYDVCDLLILAARHPGLRLSSRFDPLRSWHGHEAYVCGPAALVAAAERALAGASRVHRDLRGVPASVRRSVGVPDAHVW